MATHTATTVTMPQLGESVTEGRIGTWLKQIGERVEKFEPLVEVETDKVSTEIPAPVAGILTAILVQPDTTVPVGTPICTIELATATQGEAQPEARGSDRTNGASEDGSPLLAPISRTKGEIPDELELLRARSSPVVRRIAAERGIDLAQIPGSGIGGRVTKQDLLAYIARQERAAVTTVPEPMPVSAPPPIPERVVTPAQPAEAGRVRVFPGDEIIPVTPMRRQIAEHMVRSERTAPHVTCVMEVDMTRVVALRSALKDDFLKREGIELTYLPFVVKAVCLALRDHPRLNAVWDEDRIIQRGAIHIGIAVALEDGLIVPVIKHADRLSVAGLAHAIAQVTTKARAGSLTPDDVTGGTFTVNNPGTFGTLISTPIIVQPQVAILSTEAIIKRPVVIDDMIAIRSMMNLSLSFDHRALDGLAAARFLQQVRNWLEHVTHDQV
ncbi:MAG: 2-oxo acid dehydrogenase subunit E2 [Chloroflexota bacterium]